MKIGFIGGTGEEGMGLAYRLALAGHPCIIGSRSVDRARAAVDELLKEHGPLPLRGCTNAETAAEAELIMVTTPYSAQADTLPPLADAAAGKIVVSTVVPMAFEAGRATLSAVPEGSAAQQEQALLPKSTIVAAFQNLSAKKLLRGGPLEADVVVCADDADARTQVMKLAEAIEGVRGINGGALANAQLVEGITVLLVSINRAYRTNAGIRIAGV
ncbi:MAG TPA: NADPH-dependent F420 reductase [Dehalococcoidia bacterium]|nr:NADPH-dependent F420 reductase [Dehalococcoidia bacterium]